MGTLTDPDGNEYPMLGADLFPRLPARREYSKPDTNLAFVAHRGPLRVRAAACKECPHPLQRGATTVPR